MNHKAILIALFAMYDEELVGAERQEVEAHLAACPECQRIYTQWRQTANALFRTPQVRTSDAFVHRLMERIDALAQPRRPRPWIVGIRWLVPAMGLASLVFLVLGSTRRAVSLETLLLADGRDKMPAQFVLASEPPTTDEVFGFLMEGQP